jgi:hypothetical protein
LILIHPLRLLVTFYELCAYHVQSAPQAIADMLTRLEANFDRKLNDQFQLIQQLSASVAEHHMHSNGSQGEHYDGERKDVTSHGQTDKEPEEQQALGTRGSWDSST